MPLAESFNRCTGNILTTIIERMSMGAFFLLLSGYTHRPCRNVSIEPPFGKLVCILRVAVTPKSSYQQICDIRTDERIQIVVEDIEEVRCKLNRKGLGRSHVAINLCCSRITVMILFSVISG